jgi:hypothetical protein
MARKINTRQINITYLILVEGTTELIYFQSLKETCGRFDFTVKLQKAKHGNPAPLIEEALSEHEKGVYHSIWCVYDCDVLSHTAAERFNSAYQAALKQNIKFAESMPCIEVWFILHFEKPQNFYQNANAVIADLKKHIPQYSKNRDWQERNLYKSLKDYTTQALTNVKNLPVIKHDAQTTATSIHELIKIFNGNKHDE